MKLALSDIVLILMAAIILLMAIWHLVLDRRLARLMRGNSKNSLEDTLAQYLKRTETLTQWCEDLDAKHLMRDKQFSASIKGVGFVQYNPHDEAGPKQSFALALLNSDGNGAILSSISARDRMRIFAKSISHSQPSQALTTEETKALKQAQKTIKELTLS